MLTCIITGVRFRTLRGIQMAFSGRTSQRRSPVLNEQGLYRLRERLFRLDKHLAKLYRYSKNLNSKIDRLQREREKLVQRLEKEEVRCGNAD